MTDLLLRLKQRKLVQWAIAYVAFTFALLQGVDIVAQRFAWPDEFERVLILALAIGFVVVLVLAWYHGERGAQRVSSTEIVILALLLAIGGGLLWRFARVSNAGDASTDRSAEAAQRNPGSASPTLPVAAIPALSVAVLPLANESGEKDQQYFSDGLSEDLINALSQFAGLKVINRDSSFHFRNSNDSVQEIGEKLGVAHLLEGTVQKLGDEVRISAELVNCKDGSTLWSQHYDRPYKDLFALQDDITKSVADALKTKLLDSDSGAVAQSDRPPGGSLAAYSAYLRGKFYLQQGTAAGSQQAIAQFDEALRLDPDYAAAYAQSAHAWASLAGTFLSGAENVRDAYAKAHADVATALRLNPNLAAAHEARAGLMVSVDFDWTGALAEAQRAVQLDPGSVSAKFSLADTESRLGHVEAAVELSQQTLANAPLNGGGYFGLGRQLIGLGRLAEAETALRESIKLAPGASRPYTYLAVVEILRGNAAAALAQAKKEPAGPWHEVGVALALQVGPDRAAADAAVKKMVADYAAGDSYQIAEIYALRRDPDNMFLWLERARVNRDAGIELMLFDPFVLRYKNDPRFAAFCKKVGLPATTDAKAMP